MSVTFNLILVRRIFGSSSRTKTSVGCLSAEILRLPLKVRVLQLIRTQPFSLLKGTRTDSAFLETNRISLRGFHISGIPRMSRDKNKVDGYINDVTKDGENEFSQIHLGPQLVALIQMTATEDKAANMATCNRLIASAKEKGAKIVFLPEGFDYIARNKIESATLAEALDGPVISNYQEKARTHKIWLSLGGFHEKQDYIRMDEYPYVRNCHILIDENGTIVAKYDKIHLFDLDFPVKGVYLRESDIMLPGNHVVTPTLTPVGPVGLAICYDMRFPELALKLRLLGASILAYPSAFMVPTGEAHWESLLRARAIETQCYVICAAQVGKHNEKRESYGHSLVIDPWGEVMVDAKPEDELLVVSIDMDIVQKTRDKMPVIAHRKPSLYPVNNRHSYSIPPLDQSLETVEFGHVNVKKSMIFLESEHSRAFVNRKCVLPGHVLVTPKLRLRRNVDLSELQTSDLFMMVQKVQGIIEEIHQASSSTICMQDGRDAGQTVNHVHVHIVPRKPMDFSSNDKIYDKLEKHDEGDVQWRDDAEMIIEANKIRKHIYDKHPECFATLPLIESICTIPV